MVTISTDVIRTERPHYCKVTIFQGEDWVDVIPQMIDPSTGDPFDLTGKNFDMYIRPTADFEDIILHLASTLFPNVAGKIVIEDAEQGLVLIHVDQAVVDALPLGEWQQFLNISFTDDDYGYTTKTIWRGPCLILPDRVDL